MRGGHHRVHGRGAPRHERREPQGVAALSAEACQDPRAQSEGGTGCGRMRCWLFLRTRSMPLESLSTAQLSAQLFEDKRTSLLLSERLINCPPDVAPAMHSALLEDLETAKLKVQSRALSMHNWLEQRHHAWVMQTGGRHSPPSSHPPDQEPAGGCAGIPGGPGTHLHAARDRVLAQTGDLELRVQLCRGRSRRAKERVPQGPTGAPDPVREDEGGRCRAREAARGPRIKLWPRSADVRSAQCRA